MTAPSWIRQSEDGEKSEIDQDAALGRLKDALGAVEVATLNFICSLRQQGRDFSSICAELNRKGFAPPPGRDRWDLVGVVKSYGIRHP